MNNPAPPNRPRGRTERTTHCLLLVIITLVIAFASVAILQGIKLTEKCEAQSPQPGVPDLPSFPPTGEFPSFPPTGVEFSETNPPLVIVPDPSEALTLCQGDCDTNADCAEGLVCHQRDAFEPVPGCSGGNEDGSRTDYCVLGPQVHISLPFGEGPFEGLLGMCEGECDTDADCALGYVCHQRDEFEAVPGCIGGEQDESRSDFCVEQKYRCNPTNQDIPFNGIKMALSYEVGKLELTWKATDLSNLDVTLNSNACGGTNLKYDVFLVEGSYSFDDFTTLGDFYNVDGLISITTSELQTTFRGLKSGAAYTVIVLARIGESWISSNREGTEIQISNENPKLFAGVNLVNLSEQQIIVDSLPNSSVRMRGARLSSLKAGDWVNGVDVQGESFLFRLYSQVSQEESAAVWTVENGTFMDIYEDLTVDAVVDVTEDLSMEDSAPTTRHRNLRSPDPENSRSLINFKRKFTFEKKFKVGPVALEYKVENTYKVRARIEKKFSIFRPKLDVDVKIARTSTEETKFVFNAVEIGVEGVFSDEVSGLVARFLVGPLLYVTVQPKFGATFKGKVTAGVVLETALSTSERQTTQYRYSLGNGWEEPVRVGAPPKRVGPTFDISNKLGIEGSVTMGPSLEVSIDFIFFITGFFEGGFFLNAEVSTNPQFLPFPAPRIHISKLECIAKASFGAKFSLNKVLELIPGINGDDIETTKRFDIAQDEVFSMPKPEFVYVGHGSCDGEKAYSLYFELGAKPGKIDNGFREIPNNLVAPYNILEDFSDDTDWKFEYLGGNRAEIYVPRSGKRDESGAWAAPERLWVYGQGHISAFSTPFFAVLHREVDILDIAGAPAIHECCEDEDCSSMFGSASVCYFGTCENKEQNNGGSGGGGGGSSGGGGGGTPSAPPVRSTRVHSDPHFIGWLYSLSYQGECDLVYISTKNITVHVRTQLSANSKFSFVQAVAVSISGEILEVQNDGGVMSYFINGSTPINSPLTFGGYPFFVVGSQFVIELGQGQSIRLRQRRGMIAMDVTGNDATFGDSKGITGSFRENKAILRNNTLVENVDAEEIALEWVVDEAKGDEILFMAPSPHQGCKLPLPLNNTPAEKERAATVCAFVEDNPVFFNNCIFDVLGTGDENITDEYEEPLLTEPTCSNPNKCMEGELDASGFCQYKSIPCNNEGQNCDPIDGQCKSADDLIPAVAVIDESNVPNSVLRQDWLKFRSMFPGRPFILLQPKPDSGSLYVPQEFLDDPLTRFYTNINRDGRDGTPIEDWYALSGIGRWSDVKYVGLFVDDSGSLEIKHVQGSLDAFMANATASGIEVRKVYNGDENPFLPFITVLVRRLSARDDRGDI